MVASRGTRSREELNHPPGPSFFSFSEGLNFLSVCGISEDATTREIHILFSACPGYLSSTILADDASKRPYALVQFENADQALQACAAREGTCWEEGARPIRIDLGNPINLAKSARMRLHFNAGRQMRSPPGCVLSPPRSPRSPSRASSVRSVSSEGSPGGRVSQEDGVTSPPASSSRSLQRATSGALPSSPSGPKAEACRARIAEAMSKRRMADLQEAVEEGIALGLSEDDLSAAQQVLQKSRHRLCVRQAVFSSQKARQRLVDARKALQDGSTRPQSVKVALSQAQEAAELCGAASLRGDEQSLREDACALAKAWAQRAEECLKAAAFASELYALRQSVEEWEDLGCVLGPQDLEPPPPMSEVEVREAVAEIVAEEAGARSARRGEELSLTYILATVSLERDDWSFNALKWAILRQQARSVLETEELRALAAHRVEEALAQNASLAELRKLEQATQSIASSDVGMRLRARREALEGRLLSRWALFGAMVSSRVSTVMACIQGPLWVKWAIKQGRGVGLGKDDLEAALDCFDRTEYQRRIHDSLMEAVSAKDLVRLRAVIKEMEVIYVAEAPGHLNSFRLTMARAKLQFLDDQVAATARISHLLQVRRKTVLLEELPSAIADAQRLRVDSGSIAQAQQILQLASAQDYLQAAVEAGDRQAVREALANAQSVESWSECSLEDREKHVQQAHLFEKLSEAVQRNKLQVARHLLQEWHQQAFDSDAVADIEGLFARLDAMVAKAQAAIDALLQQPVAFGSGTATLMAEGEAMLKRLTVSLQQFPQVCLRVDAYSGHANDRVAQELATNRADVVKQSLRKFGCKNKVVAKSWGNSEIKKAVVRITAHGQLGISDHLACHQK